MFVKARCLVDMKFSCSVRIYEQARGGSNSVFLPRAAPVNWSNIVSSTNWC
jgi:hypothetical protein